MGFQSLHWGLFFVSVLFLNLIHRNTVCLIGNRMIESMFMFTSTGIGWVDSYFLLMQSVMVHLGTVKLIHILSCSQNGVSHMHYATFTSFNIIDMPQICG